MTVSDVVTGITSIFTGKSAHQQQVEQREAAFRKVSGTGAKQEPVWFGRGGVSRRGETKQQRAAREIAERIAREKVAEAKRIAEELARKKAEQQKLLREQQQKASQEKYMAGTIGGQVTRTDLTPKFDYQRTVQVTPATYEKPARGYEVDKRIIPITKDVAVGGLFRKPIEREPIKEKAKRFGVGLFTPSIAPSEVKKLPEKERGLEATKGIFLGGLEGLYQYAKKSTKEVDVKIPVRTGILTPIVGKKKPITLRKVKPARVIAEVIPRTTAGVLAIRYFPKLPKVIQTPITGYIAGVGVKGVLDTSRTKEERIASGLIATGATIGTVVQVYPYARGLKAQTIGRITGKYKPVKVQLEGFEAIQLKETRIGLIQPGPKIFTGIKGKKIIIQKGQAVDLPKISPLKRGAFQVKPSEKALFLGKGQTVATSQRGLFKVGTTIKPTPSAPKEFFVTPQDPFAKIPVTRVSRLGLEKPVAVPKQIKIGFGLPKKPQIGVETGVKIARVEKAGAYRIGTGTELEAIKTMPTIQVGKKLGVTTIRGQAIDIFQIKTTPTKGVSPLVPKVPTTKGVTRISGEAVLSTSLATQKITTIAPLTTRPTSIKELQTRVIAPSKPKTSRRVPESHITITYPSTTLTPTAPLPSKVLTSISSPLIPYKKIPRAPPFILPRPDIRFREKSKPLRQLFPAPSRYQPSFSGVLLGRRTKVPEHYERFGFGGLQLRGIPILEPTKKRKKKEDEFRLF